MADDVADPPPIYCSDPDLTDEEREALAAFMELLREQRQEKRLGLTGDQHQEDRT